jgi:hypothetical protein
MKCAHTFACSTAKPYWMTSSNPLAELALTALKQAAESPRPLTAAQQYDLAYLRSLTPSQRIALLQEILSRAEAFGLPQPDLEPIRCNDMRL